MQTDFPYLTIHRRIILFSLLFSTAIFIGSCKDKSQNKQWDNVSIDPTITVNPFYEQLNKESECYSVFEKQDTSAKRTSGVLYFTKGQIGLSDSSSARLNNCRAYFFHGEKILSINIGIGNGFGGWGFIINYHDKKFYTEPYHSTDVVNPNEPEPIYQIVFQKLTLDKPACKVGDSLFGKINFNVIEINQDKSKIEHSGKGYFRTIVKKL